MWILLTEQHSDRADGLFLLGRSPSLCHLACSSKKVGSLLTHLIRCLKNPGCFWSANEKRLSPFWNIKTWLRGHAGDEAAWLSCSDIILVSVIARDSWPRPLTACKFLLLCFTPAVTSSQPIAACLLDDSVLCAWDVQVMFLLPEVCWNRAVFCILGGMI